MSRACILLGPCPEHQWQESKMLLWQGCGSWRLSRGREQPQADLQDTPGGEQEVTPFCKPTRPFNPQVGLGCQLAAAVLGCGQLGAGLTQPSASCHVEAKTTKEHSNFVLSGWLIYFYFLDHLLVLFVLLVSFFFFPFFAYFHSVLFLPMQCWLWYLIQHSIQHLPL